MEIGNIKIVVCKDYEAVSKKSAEIFAAQLKSNPKSVVCFATGSSPVGMYKEMIAKYKAGEVDFSEITALNLDEYYPIKKSNEQSYDYFMRDNLFNHINLDFSKQFILNGESADYEKECRDYDNLIHSYGEIDFQILGIGINGHIGFNEPCESLSAETHMVSLAQSTIDANARFFSSADEVPKHALTMGIGPIIKSKKALLIACGENKAETLYNAFMKNITTNMPGSFLQLHRDVTAVIDEAAFSCIKKNMK